VLGDGRLFCWGANSVGQLGLGFSDRNVGDGIGPSVADAGLVDLGDRKAVDVSAGGALTCVVLDDGGVRRWGRGLGISVPPEFTFHGYTPHGILGDTPATIPALLPNLPISQPIASVAVGGTHVCALSRTGSVYCWGFNGYGKVGHPGTYFVGGVDSREEIVVVDSTLVLDRLDVFGPVELAMTSDGPVKDLAVSDLGTCVRTESARVYCWGVGGTEGVDIVEGMTVSSKDIPAVSKTLAASAIVGTTAVGFGAELCFLFGQGSVRCRGWTASEASPAWSNGPVFGFSQLKTLAHGGAKTASVGDRRHYCALSTGGNVRCLGFNEFGQLGRGSTATLTSADVDLNLGTRATGIASGLYSTCTVGEDGGVRCWGSNINGQMGIGSTNHIGDEAGEMPPSPIRFKSQWFSGGPSVLRYRSSSL